MSNWTDTGKTLPVRVCDKAPLTLKTFIGGGTTPSGQEYSLHLAGADLEMTLDGSDEVYKVEGRAFLSSVIALREPKT